MSSPDNDVRRPVLNYFPVQTGDPTIKELAIMLSDKAWGRITIMQLPDDTVRVFIDRTHNVQVFVGSDTPAAVLAPMADKEPEPNAS